MIVLRTDLAEAGTNEQLERIRKILESNGGAVSAIHEWGVRELAYPIEKERRGYYALAEYTGTAATVAEIERHLKLSDLVLRFVSVRQEKDQPVGPPPRFEERVEAGAELEGQEDLETVDVDADAEAEDLE
jgi:small subunit ribosomal protein S6